MNYRSWQKGIFLHVTFSYVQLKLKAVKNETGRFRWNIESLNLIILEMKSMKLEKNINLERGLPTLRSHDAPLTIS